MLATAGRSGRASGLGSSGGPCRARGPVEHRTAGECRFELGQGDGAMAKNLRGEAGQVEDGRLKPDGRRPAIDHQVDLVFEIGQDVLGPGG